MAVSRVTITPVLGPGTTLPPHDSRTRIRGLQCDVDYSFASFWRVSGGYLFNNAKVREFATTGPSLVGKFLPHVPKYRELLQIAYANPAG